MAARVASRERLGDAKDRRRVDAAADRDGDRRRAAQTPSNGVFKVLHECVGVIFKACEPHLSREIEIPISLCPNAVAGDDDAMRWKHADDVLKERRRLRLLTAKAPEQK